MKDIEQKIWDYLDGTCSEQERKLTAQLIENDPEYRSVYEECQSVHLNISATELDEPSMSFTRNVMEKLQMEPVPGLVRSLIDKRIIYGIAAFFLITITGLLGLLFYQIDWSQYVTSGMPNYQIPEIDISKYLNTNLIYVFFFADIIAGLYLFDGFLRKRTRSKNI